MKYEALKTIEKAVEYLTTYSEWFKNAEVEIDDDFGDPKVIFSQIKRYEYVIGPQDENENEHIEIRERRYSMTFRLSNDRGYIPEAKASVVGTFEGVLGINFKLHGAEDLKDAMNKFDKGFVEAGINKFWELTGK